MVKALKRKGTYCVDSWRNTSRNMNLQKKEWYSGNKNI